MDDKFKNDYIVIKWAYMAREYKLNPFRVVYKGKDNWAIMLATFCYDKTKNKFVPEPFPSSRTDNFLKSCRFKLFETEQFIDKLLSEKCVKCKKRKYSEIDWTNYPFSDQCEILNIDKEGLCYYCRKTTNKDES